MEQKIAHRRAILVDPIIPWLEFLGLLSEPKNKQRLCVNVYQRTDPDVSIVSQETFIHQSSLAPPRLSPDINKSKYFTLLRVVML